ncbi:MAG: cytochrome c [Ectothiorhodospiraceae bacterium]|nr:cytochrome c [Chromatiales bacterium]MCP5154108.1 cytochrome c [Ectothiorhodospiraceae bacterium]
MSGRFSQTTARNVFYGGSAFFILLLLALTFDTSRALPERDNRHNLTEQVALGKSVWERNNCIGCHTLMGEGAYFAPELGNVYERRGPDFIKAWMKAMPTNAPGRRQMPQFNLGEEELDALIEFLKWTNAIDDENWPPNIQG